ncbi:MAG TPA: CrcB family protein [Mycobacteriales bacterium]|nr:CrcB family protein [Mycobacteriales bacterium]
MTTPGGHHWRPAEWPVDTDVTVEDVVPQTAGHPHRPSLDPLRLGLVVAGGFAGGLVRYAVVDHWRTPPSDFPWPTFVVNTAGAFVLGVLVIVVLEVLAESRYLRPLLGAGFCGALTTFSSVAVVVDQQLRHRHIAVAIAYLVGSLAAGLVAAALGAELGKALPATAARRRLEDGGR